MIEGAEHNNPQPGRWAFLEAEAYQWGINHRPLLHGTPVKTILLFVSGSLRSVVFEAPYDVGGVQLNEGVLWRPLLHQASGETGTLYGIPSCSPGLAVQTKRPSLGGGRWRSQSREGPSHRGD